ncbi:MAG TPA: hypothetical protein VHP14_05220 [Anaerolineales bacterium]|nr:hypothetical protein [Anaerolineales bacterium]
MGSVFFIAAVSRKNLIACLRTQYYNNARSTVNATYKMKSQTPLYVLLVFALTLLGVLWSFPDWELQEEASVFPATIHRDCSPENTLAFTISIPIAKSVIGISIYQSPDIDQPASFSFPDDTGQIGNALRLLPSSWPDPLIGKVSFQRVEPGMPVEGEFSFVTDLGERIKGRFIAEWNSAPIVCGRKSIIPDTN